MSRFAGAWITDGEAVVEGCYVHPIGHLAHPSLKRYRQYRTPSAPASSPKGITCGRTAFTGIKTHLMISLNPETIGFIHERATLAATNDKYKPTK
jgi:hypothetical protein